MRANKQGDLALPSVQFISEHKGTLSIVLAARTYYEIDVEAYKVKIAQLAAASGDCWTIQVGVFDHHPGNLAKLHQCEFLEILGYQDADIAFFFVVDATWNLGTKAWQSIDIPVEPLPPGKFWVEPSRYMIVPSHKVRLPFL